MLPELYIMFCCELETHLKYASTVRRAPSVQQIVLAGADEPLAAVGELERRHAAVVQVKFFHHLIKFWHDFAQLRNSSTIFSITQ